MAEAELQKLLDAGPARAPSAVTFGAACREWLRYLEEEKGVAERTLGTNTGAMSARLVPFFGEDTPLGGITTATIDAYRAHSLTTGGARGRALKRTTVQRDLTNLSGVFARALRLGWIDTNPYIDAEKVRYVPSGDFNVLTVLEVESTSPARARGPLYRVAAYTGLRLGELRALRWGDVEFVNASIHVRRNLPVHAREEKTPKGRRVRSLPLFDQAVRALDDLSRRDYLTRPDDLVFVGEAGGHLDYPFTFHDLRHSYGTLAVQIYPVTEVQIYMGHEKIETTMRYVHHVPKTDAAAKGSASIAAQIETVSPPCPEPTRSEPADANSAQLRPA